MVQQITNKIMLGGINNYANKFNVQENDVQIRLTNLDGENIKYEICNKWQPVEAITFKDILNKKMDILGYEQLATPVLKKSVLLYHEELNIDLNDLSLFLFNHKGKIAIAVFDRIKNVKLVTLSDHFDKIGL